MISTWRAPISMRFAAQCGRRVPNPSHARPLIGLASILRVALDNAPANSPKQAHFPGENAENTLFIPKRAKGRKRAHAQC